LRNPVSRAPAVVRSGDGWDDAGAMNASVRAGADLRLLRAAVFAAVCVALSAAGHGMASGAVVPVWALVAAWAAVSAVTAALAGRERRLPGIAALMLGCQAALHLLFAAGQFCAAPARACGGGRAARVMALAERLVCNGHVALTPVSAERLVRQAGIDPASAPPVGTGQAMPGMPGMTGMTATGATAGGHGAMGYSVPMVAGHLVAALVAGWLLHRGEAALWRLVRLSVRGAGQLRARSPLGAVLTAVRALARVAAGRPAPRTAGRRRDADEGARRPGRSALRHSVGRRGPPRRVLAA